jgi:hypothetical protein
VVLDCETALHADTDVPEAMVHRVQIITLRHLMVTVRGVIAHTGRIFDKLTDPHGGLERRTNIVKYC